MSLYYLEQAPNTNFFENTGFNNKFNLDNYENFSNVPEVDSVNSDNMFQCSNNVQITGNVIGNPIQSSSLDDCKTQCKSNSSCVGFDFSNSTCVLKNTISDLSDKKPNNLMCVKKTASSCNVKSSVDPAIEAERAIGLKNDKMRIANSVNSANMSSKPETMAVLANAVNGENMAISSGENLLNSKPTSTEKQDCKLDTIYVDLPCYLNKMEGLKNHSEDLMVDLQLLISNLKSCSYVKKSHTNKKPTSSENPLKPISGDSPQTPDHGLMMPVQETIKIYNSPASVLYAGNPNTNTNTMLGLVEPFAQSEGKKCESPSSLTLVVFLALVLVLFYAVFHQ
jgi:hypothetical protein